MDLIPHIERFERRFAEVEAALSDPRVLGNQSKMQEMSREYARLKGLVESGRRYVKIVKDIDENRQILREENAESEMAAMAQEELTDLEEEFPKVELAIKMGIIPPDPTDSRNTIFEIRAGAGGSEAALFVSDLCRMYTRYAENSGWRMEIMDASLSDLGGYKEIIFSIQGEDVFKRLKYESGVHRVQRVPATESQGRIHTSTVTVAVLPEAEEVDIDIRPDDIEVSVCRASGPGGQGVNTTDSAVQILHKATGMIVRCADERSQIKNKAKAMTVLRSRLLEQKIAEENAKYAAQRKSQVGSGERNERIRTYNFPQNRLTDHRIELTLYNLPQVMEGEIECVLDPLMANDMESRLSEMNL